MCVSVRTGVACVWLRAVCASVCVWNVLSVCVMRLVCRPGVSMKILNGVSKMASASPPYAIVPQGLEGPVCACADVCLVYSLAKAPVIILNQF